MFSPKKIKLVNKGDWSYTKNTCFVETFHTVFFLCRKIYSLDTNDLKAPEKTINAENWSNPVAWVLSGTSVYIAGNSLWIMDLPSGTYKVFHSTNWSSIKHMCICQNHLWMVGSEIYKMSLNDGSYKRVSKYLENWNSARGIIRFGDFILIIWNDGLYCFNAHGEQGTYQRITILNQKAVALFCTITSVVAISERIFFAFGSQVIQFEMISSSNVTAEIIERNWKFDIGTGNWPLVLSSVLCVSN